MKTPLYLTTTIPYVNAAPHVGFALELVQADALARYHRLSGRDVRFQTGTDDNALSNVLSARLRNRPVEDFVEENSAAFQDLCTALDISNDRFLRTTEAAHHRAVRSFLSSLPPDDTYIDAYRGQYCPRCEDFYRDQDTSGGRCPEHRIELDEIEETNHFFRLSRYQSVLHDLIASRQLEVVPRVREREVLRFIDDGLHDFSISRSAVRSGGWGVPFPNDPEQVVYVWVDALINYLTGLGFPEGGQLRRFWTSGSERVHVIGKNVWKFHAVYWPALLISAGLDLPDRVFVHGFLTEDGRKISKSAGNAEDPARYVETFGVDAVRHCLLAHTRPFEDTDFSVPLIERVYRADLANTLGNLCTRLTALCEVAGVPGVTLDAPLVAPQGYREQLEGFRFDLAAAGLWRSLRELNREIAEERPWESLKAGDGAGEDGAAVGGAAVVGKLSDWAARLCTVAHWLRPFLPSTASEINRALTASRIRKCRPLFPRLQ